MRTSKDKSRRMRAEDGPHWSPTEAHRRNELMRQFIKGEVSLGKSEAYRQGYEAIDWGDPMYPEFEITAEVIRASTSASANMENIRCAIDDGLITKEQAKELLEEL